jgi:glycosyltransferase involved in cell wall biosynthesis
MRILHVVHQYLPEHVGGTELYTQMLARHQASQLGHDVAVFFPTARGGVPPSDEAGVRHFAVEVRERNRQDVFLATWRQHELAEAFATTLAAVRPDVVHVQHLMGLPATLATAIREAGLPYVVTLHDYWYPCANAQLVTNYDQTLCDGPHWWLNCAHCALARAGHGERGWLRPVLAPLMAHRSFLLRRVLAGAAAVIAPTRFVRDTYTRLSMPTDSLRVVSHGIQLPPEVSASSVPEKHGRDDLHLLYVGSIAWQKGVHVLVEAMNRLPAGVRLTLFGDASAYPDYAAMVQAAAKHPGIRFAGQASRDRLWQTLLDEADVLVVPSVWYETAALVVQEAFAAGVPVVASGLGALAERVQHGVDGLLFPPGDAGALCATLLRLVEDEALLPRLRQGIQPVRTIAEHAADVQAVYDSVT